jgi:hypothetical protein
LKSGWPTFLEIEGERGTRSTRILPCRVRFTRPWCDRFNVMSYAMARLKADKFNYYRNEDPRCRRERTEADLRNILADDRHQKLVGKGGTWWLHTEQAKTEARGDHMRVAQIQK